MTTYQMLETLNRPVAYGFHSEEQTLPYFVIMGAGQDVFAADNTYYHTQERERIEYYFKHKDPAFEAEIEALLLANDKPYDKSEDVYIDDQGVFVIYYYI